LDSISQIQLGKQGVTESFIITLESHFKNHKNVKVSVLKSFCRDKQELKKISQEIVDKLGKNFIARTLGYTINIKKWRKDIRGSVRN